MSRDELMRALREAVRREERAGPRIVSARVTDSTAGSAGLVMAPGTDPVEGVRNLGCPTAQETFCVLAVTAGSGGKEPFLLDVSPHRTDAP